MLESELYRRLAYTWHTFTPEWRDAARDRVGFSEQFLEHIAAEPRSKVLFEISELDDELVKLTVIHDGFEAGSEVLETISQGWPHILSNLKTLLETGQTLVATESAAANGGAFLSRSSHDRLPRSVQRVPVSAKRFHAHVAR